MDYTKSLKVNKSKKHGRGVYAGTDIPKGVKVIEYVGKKVTEKQSEGIYERQMKNASKKGVGHVYLFTLNSKYDIDGNYAYNKARLINHSCDPNCEVEIIKGHIWIMSLKKIAAGEELTYNYGFNMDFWQDHVCRCGTSKCLGYIVSASRRGALSRVLKALEKEKKAKAKSKKNK
jgi:uncharacterized protein